MKFLLALTSLSLLISSVAGADTFNIKFNLANLDGKKGMNKSEFFLSTCKVQITFFFSFVASPHSITHNPKLICSQMKHPIAYQYPPPKKMF